MSFSQDVKEELSKVKNLNNKNLLKAEFVGYMLTGNVDINSKSDYIEFNTENEFNIERFYKILFNLDIPYEPEVNGKTYTAIIKITDEIRKIFEIMIKNSEEERRAIIKGAFMGSGSISNPNSQNHLEIRFNNKRNLEFIRNLCREYDINFKVLDKKKLYIKDGESISTFLALIGANQSVLKYEDIRVLRDIKNSVNRKVNCETANLNKTIVASVNQVEDINLLKRAKKFDELPESLKEVATLRLENPDSSLSELAELCKDRISKSGINHRLNKIHELAEELRK